MERERRKRPRRGGRGLSAAVVCIRESMSRTRMWGSRPPRPLLSLGLLRRKVNYVVTPFMTRIRHIVFIYEMGFDGAEWKSVPEKRVEI